MSQCRLQPRDFGAEIFSAHIMSTEEAWAWPSSCRGHGAGPAPLNKLLIAQLADDVDACDIQNVHVESLQRSRRVRSGFCHLSAQAIRRLRPHHSRGENQG